MSQTAGLWCLYYESQLWDQEGDGHAGVRGRRQRGRGTVASAREARRSYQMSDRIGSAASVPSAPPRWVFSLFNPIVRFLLSAGVPLGLNGLITIRGRKEEVRATELDPTQRVEFFRDILGPLARGVPFGAWFIRTVDGVDLDRPSEAAEGRRVFELHPLR